MAKGYICDICTFPMTHPHDAHMREFYIGVEFDHGEALPCKVKTRKCRIHICDTCYHNLINLAIKKNVEDKSDG